MDCTALCFIRKKPSLVSRAYTDFSLAYADKSQVSVIYSKSYNRLKKYGCWQRNTIFCKETLDDLSQIEIDLSKIYAIISKNFADLIKAYEVYLKRKDFSYDIEFRVIYKKNSLDRKKAKRLAD